MRCDTCSTRLGDLSILYLRGDITRADWMKVGYQLVVEHHPDWTMMQSWDYSRSRAPFYPFHYEA